MSNIESPHNWDMKKLEDVCVKITDGAHQTPTYVESGVPFLRVKDIHNEKIDWNKVKKISKSEHDELTKRCKPELGDVLYSKNGTIGISKIVDWENEFSIFVSLALLKPNKELVDAHYLKFFLDSALAKDQAFKRSKTASVTNLHLEEIREILIPLPSIPHQRKIVQKLDYVFKQFEEKENEIESFHNFKKLQKSESLLTQMIFDGLISGKLTQNWREKNNIVKKWDVRLLDGLTMDSKNGKTGTPKDTPPGIPRLGITTITQQSSGYVNESECRFLEIPRSEVEKYSVIDGDLLFCRQNGNKEFVGKCAVYRGSTKPLIFSDSLIRFRIDLTNILPEFLIIFVSSTKGRTAIEQFCNTTAGNYSINSSNLKQILIDLPTLKEQEEIIKLKNEHIKKIDNMKKVIEKFLVTKEKVLSNIESIQNSILNTAFSGKLVN